MGAGQSCAIYGTSRMSSCLLLEVSSRSVEIDLIIFSGPCDACTGVALRNVQIDGNRGGLGWIPGGLALVEMGGNAPGQISALFFLFAAISWC